jgi:hypothetical protein
VVIINAGINKRFTNIRQLISGEVYVQVINRYALLLMGLALWLCFLPQTGRTAPSGLAYVQYTENPQTEVTISWASDVSSPTVQYGPTPSLGSTATGSSVQNGATYHNHVKVTGLSAGTTYYYSYESNRSGTFRTAASSGAFRFAIPGDVQYWEAICPQFQAAARWLAQAQDPVFWIPLGDVSAKGMVQSTWDYLFFSSENLVTKSVFMPVMGNHDCTISGGTVDAYPQVWVDMMRFPDNGGGASYPQSYYSFEYSNALFVMLNYHYNAERYFPGIVNAQTTWLDSTLQRSDRRWKFICVHDPGFPSEWMDLFKRYGVQAVFTGHTHAYAAGFNGAVYCYTAEAAYADASTTTVPVVEVDGETATVYTYNYNDGTVVHSQVVSPGEVAINPNTAATYRRDPGAGNKLKYCLINSRKSGAIAPVSQVYNLKGNLVPWQQVKNAHGIYLVPARR